MERKLIKIGTSTGVIIPKDVLTKKGLRAGDHIRFDLDTTTSKKSKERETVRPEVIQIAEDVIEEYRPLLEKLANS